MTVRLRVPACVARWRRLGSGRRQAVVLISICAVLLLGDRVRVFSTTAERPCARRDDDGPGVGDVDAREVVIADDDAVETAAPSRRARISRALQDACSTRSGGTREHLGKSTRARVLNTQFDMFVYGGTSGVRDIVSDSISGSGAWERPETETLMSLLSKDKNGTTRGSFLDVGANIGWFSMVALHLGHDVIAFEPFQSNVDLICASLESVSPPTAKKFRLHQIGLDTKRRECELFQQKHINIGDTHAVCDEKTRAHFLGAGYASLGWMNTTTLDDAFVDGAFDHLDRIDVMKIDVEGFEPAVIAGGNRFFESKYAPRYVFMEMVSSLMDSASGAKGRGQDYLRTTLLHLGNHGYELDSYSERDNNSVSLQSSPFEEVWRHADGKNVLFVRRDEAGK